MTNRKHIHFIGIGGAGMSAIARVLLERGFTVSGSDMQFNQLMADLERDGASVFGSHAAEQIAGAHMVVISSAIPESNVELQAARERNLPVLKRDQFLGSLMGQSEGIAVAGSHGKTTTSGMIAHLLLWNAQDPTFIIGGTLATSLPDGTRLDSNGRSGRGPHFVIEADEYDHMFLGLRPRVAVITNIEHDHPDIYPTLQSYLRAFRQFAELVPPNGRLIGCQADANTLNLLTQLKETRPITTYGFETAQLAGVDHLQAQALTTNAVGGSSFEVVENGQLLGTADLPQPGRHNVLNALAAIATGRHIGLSFEQCAAALAHFPGMGRRFEVRGNVANITVLDDYAHHPTEIRATLQAARQRYPQKRIWAVWQPHTFSRTRLLLEQFCTSFDDADRVLVLDVYRSREKRQQGINSQEIVAEIAHPGVAYGGDLLQATQTLIKQVAPNDVIITLNAGDARLVGEWLLDDLRERTATAFLEQRALEEREMARENARAGKTAEDHSHPLSNSQSFELQATREQVKRLVNKLKNSNHTSRQAG